MKKKKFKPFIVSHGTYPFDVMVCVGMSHEEVLHALKRVGCEISAEEAELIRRTGDGRTGMLSGGATVLQVKDTNAPQLAHEIFHAVEFLFDRIGSKYHIDSSEAWAYQIQHLTEAILKKLNPRP